MIEQPPSPEVWFAHGRQQHGHTVQDVLDMYRWRAAWADAQEAERALPCFVVSPEVEPSSFLDRLRSRYR